MRSTPDVHGRRFPLCGPPLGRQRRQHHLGDGRSLLMEKMPYQGLVETASAVAHAAVAPAPSDSTWRRGLPTLIGSQVILRELRLSDAPALFAAMSAKETSRFISPPPATVEGF